MTEYRKQPGERLGFNWMASMISDVDGKKCILHVRKYHVWFYHSWLAPSPWNPEEFAKMPSYADYRLDLDNL